MTRRLRIALITIAMSAASFALKAPTATQTTRLTPDSASYFNVARNLASGRGYVSTLKQRYPDGSGVRHCALTDWPPAYPAFSALLVRHGADMIALQTANAMLVSISAALVFLLGVRLFGLREGLMAGCAAALAPNLFRAGIVALSDALALTLALAAILIALSSRGAWAWLAAGVIAGAAALTRYPCAVVALGLIGWALIDRKDRILSLACAAGFAVTVTPFALCSLSNGSPVQALHYCVGSFHEAMWHSQTTIDPLYALHHPAQVAALTARNVLVYASDLLIGPRGLFILGLGLLAWLLTARKHPMAREHKLVLAIAALSFTVHALTWSVPAVKGSRFMLLTYCALLPFCTSGLLRYSMGRLGPVAAAVLVITGLVYVWGCATAASFRGTDFPLPPETARSIADSLPSGTNLASDNPWVVNYSTGLPTVILPRDLDDESLARYIRDMKIGKIVLLGNRRCAQSAISNRYGQNAYEGKWKIMPHIVQKLPTTHSPRITPRKNGSARL